MGDGASERLVIRTSNLKLLWFGGGCREKSHGGASEDIRSDGQSGTHSVQTMEAQVMYGLHEWTRKADEEMRSPERRVVLRNIGARLPG